MIYKILKTKEDIVITNESLLPEVYNMEGDYTFGMIPKVYRPFEGTFTLPANSIIQTYEDRNRINQNKISFSDNGKSIISEPVLFPEAFDYWWEKALEQGCIEQIYDSEKKEISFYEFIKSLQ